MSVYTPLIKRYPKVKPLARTLIEAAAEQGANTEELKLACDMAQEAYRSAMDQSAVLLSKFEGEAKTSLDRF